MRIFLAALAVAAAAFVLWGIGSATHRLVRARSGRWPVSIGIGLSVLICTGGILNLAHIAYRPALWVLIAAGIVVSAFESRRTNFSRARAIPKETAARVELALAALVISAVVLFAIATQLPPRVFNFQDDLQKYLAHPVRMLETGTLAGSPLNALGSETLGGQAYLHGFVLSALPLPYVNGVDSVFGLFVLMLIAAAAGWRRFAWFPGAALGAVFVAAVNPLYVNISALYLGAALIATAVMLVADQNQDASPVLLGLIYAALVAVKPIYGLFAALHLPLSLIADGMQSAHWKRATMWAARTGIWAAVFLAPWFAMYLPTYLSQGVFVAQVTPVAADSDGVSLFSTARVFGGDSILSFTAIAALGVLVAILVLLGWRRNRVPQSQSDQQAKPLGIFAGAAAGFASFLLLILYLSKWAGYHPCVRYAVPFTLGTCVITALMAPSLADRLPRSLCTIVPGIAILAIVLSCGPSAIQRIEEAKQYHTILSFPDATQSPAYAPYMQFSLSDQARQQVAQLQSHVPPSESLFAWIDTPYWLDYSRNHIVDIDPAGTATRWAHVPPDVHYFLWQYKGFAVWEEGDYQFRMHAPGIGARDRLIAIRSFALANTLTDLANHAEVVARLDTPTDHYVLFRLASAGAN